MKDTDLLFMITSLAVLGNASKQGLALGGELAESDIRLMTSAKSPISWYYNWSPSPSNLINDSTVFLPLIHGVDTLGESDIWSILDGLPDSSTHLLTFNEPDEDESNGGSFISPEDAAEAYVKHLVPHRDGKRKWNISHPVVTGSERGLKWLREFNESCYKQDPDNGCPSDFAAVHWFGDFTGLKSWLGTLQGFYSSDTSRNISMWITEMALPKGDEEANLAMLNESMMYLDGLDYIDGYAWFGAFRKKDSNDWTGGGVSLLDNKGHLNSLGEQYLGDDSSGFEEDSGCDKHHPIGVSFLICLVAVIAFTAY